MTGLAREYGDGLYELARDENIRPQVHSEIMEIAGLLKAQPEFARLLTSRAIERETRLKVVDETFAGRAHPYVVSFMKLLVEKERFDCFDESAKWLHQRYNDDFGIVEAQVTTAVELSQAERDALQAKLESISGRKVSIVARVDKDLIGGVRVEMDGRRYDNTIQNKLGRLKASMAHVL